MSEPRPRPQRKKPLAALSIEETEEYLAGLETEIRSAECGRCRRNRLRTKIDKAEAHIVRMRRANMIAEATRDG